MTEQKFKLVSNLKTSIEINSTLLISSNEILINYEIIDPSKQVRWPEFSKNPTFKDNLYQTTCLEFFALDSASKHYLEWNFSPSTDWAFFAFEGYRKKNTNYAFVHQPKIKKVNQTSFEVAIDKKFDFDRYNITAVIELEAEVANNHSKLYFSVKNPGEKPDFHHNEYFLDLESRS